MRLLALMYKNVIQCFLFIVLDLKTKSGEYQIYSRNIQLQKYKEATAHFYMAH